MPDEHGNITDADCAAFIEKADKETLWWGMFKLLGALYSARACDRSASGSQVQESGVAYTGPSRTWRRTIGESRYPACQEDFSEVQREIAEDEAYHNMTYAAESMGLRITGDEFI